MTCLLGYGSVLGVFSYLYITHGYKEGRFFFFNSQQKIIMGENGHLKLIVGARDNFLRVTGCSCCEWQSLCLTVYSLTAFSL